MHKQEILVLLSYQTYAKLVKDKLKELQKQSNTPSRAVLINMSKITVIKIDGRRNL